MPSVRVPRADGANQHSRESRPPAPPRPAPPPAGDRSGDPIARGRRGGRQRQKDRMTRWTQLFEDPDAGTSRSVCPVEAAGASSVPPARVMS